MIELILGGARSGKSHLAERLAHESGLPVTCIVTATAGDEEMRLRIERHQRERDPSWQVVEAPVRLAAALRACPAGRCVIVDCLTLWLSNLILHEEQEGEALLRREVEALTATLQGYQGRAIFVGNEVGQGIVPLGAVNRRFVDESGWLHQAIARLADRVILVTAGISQILKGDDIDRMA